jgi:hypothetical protein
MRKELNLISIFILILISISCKNEKKNDTLNLKKETELKTDSTSESYNEIAYPSDGRIHTTSKYNADIKSIKNIKRPKKTIIRNLEIDTTQAFGIWTQNPTGDADFWLTSKSFLVADYDGNGDMPYLLDKNEITIYYNDFILRGVITFTSNDLLKIKWNDIDVETEYVKFEN